MPEINKIRKRRRKNVSADAFANVSDFKNRPMLKEEIYKMIDSLEADMLYLEGYISLEEKENYKRNGLPTHSSPCKRCGVSLSDYVIWNDIIIYENGLFQIVKIPLSRNNIVSKFKQMREECVEAGEKMYKSYLLGEISDKEKIISVIEDSCCISGEELVIGLTCPRCGCKIDDVQLSKRAN